MASRWRPRAKVHRVGNVVPKPATRRRLQPLIDAARRGAVKQR